MGVGAVLYMYDVVVKKFTFAISSPDEFLVISSFYFFLAYSQPSDIGCLCLPSTHDVALVRI